MSQLRWTDDGALEADVDGRTRLVLHFPGWETMLATLSRPMPEPALVLVIDDMGQKLEPAEQLASLPFPVALALWPHAAARRPVQQVARDMGLAVLLHMPMEAMPRKNGTAPNPGPGALETDMDAYAMEHALDKALAARKDELFDVKIHGGVTMWMPEVCKADDAGDHFTWNSWHCSGMDRKIIGKGMGNYEGLQGHGLFRPHALF